MILALGTLGGVGFVVIQQLSQLATDLAENRGAIEKKISDIVAQGKPSNVGEIQDMLDDVSRGVTSGGVFEESEGESGEARQDAAPTEPVLAETPEMPGSSARSNRSAMAGPTTRPVTRSRSRSSTSRPSRTASARPSAP